MRSRYTAYSFANVTYIKQTMQGKMLLGFSETDALAWAKKVTWLGLTVVRSYFESPAVGFVEFKARFLDNNKLQTMHELSEFHLIDQHWLYTDGSNRELANTKQAVPRTSPCPCGSGKKFKNCHEK